MITLQIPILISPYSQFLMYFGPVLAVWFSVTDRLHCCNNTGNSTFITNTIRTASCLGTANIFKKHLFTDVGLSCLTVSSCPFYNRNINHHSPLMASSSRGPISLLDFTTSSLTEPRGGGGGLGGLPVLHLSTLLISEGAKSGPQQLRVYHGCISATSLLFKATVFDEKSKTSHSWRISFCRTVKNDSKVGIHEVECS